MKRLNFLCTFFFITAFLLMFRVFYIGVVKNEEYTKGVMAQRTHSVSFKSPRGIIYDRNMLKITDAEMKLVVKDGKPYYVENRDGNILSHVIGYISPDGKGSGIEGAFNYVLDNDKSSSISYLKDINNNKISQGYAINIKDVYSGICLTIDYHVQKIAEEVMDKHKINGAVIVADCKSGEILAMASRPDYDASNLEQYLDGTEGELLNKAVLQYNPGSVFKIAVATAFAENHYNDEILFECNGKTEIDGVEFVCHKEEGHGIQTLEQAFANSCNCAFYELGRITGIGEIHRYATEYGMESEILRINGIYEDTGYVPQCISNNAELANVSIGQGDVMVTPVQVADMLCTICNGGIRNQLTLIRGIVDENGECNKTESTKIGRVISETTARRLQNMMITAVKEGTGKSADIPVGAGGKTGSAETGWLKNGEFLQQGWFGGYFPADNPKYVCVVMAENGTSGSESACPVFRDIGINICNIFSEN